MGTFLRALDAIFVVIITFTVKRPFDRKYTHVSFQPAAVVVVIVSHQVAKLARAMPGRQ